MRCFKIIKTMFNRYLLCHILIIVRAIEKFELPLSEQCLYFLWCHTTCKSHAHGNMEPRIIYVLLDKIIILHDCTISISMLWNKCFTNIMNIYIYMQFSMLLNSILRWIMSTHHSVIMCLNLHLDIKYLFLILPCISHLMFTVKI